MSLRSKIVLALCLVAILWAAVDNVLMRTLVGTHFEELTDRTALDALVRAESDLDRDVERLRETATGFAVSGVVRGAVRAGDLEALGRATEDGALEHLGLDLFVVLGEQGEVLRYFARDASGAPTSYRLFPSEALAPTNPVLKQAEAGRFGSLMSTEHGFLAVAAYALPFGDDLLSDLATLRPAPEEGRGAIIAGTLVPERRDSEAFGHASVIRMIDTVRSELTEAQRRGLATLGPARDGEAHFVEELDDGSLAAYRLREDLEGKPTLLLEARLAPDALLDGRRVRQFLALSTVATSTLIFLVLLRLLQRAVIAPLTELTSHVVEIGRTDDTGRRLAMDRGDEIGQLSGEFDRMLDKLEESRRLLMVSARQAGMSEIATGVLHNVGNVLNSVNVSRSLIDRKLEAFAIGDLERAVDVLQQHADDLAAFIGEDPRGRNLLPFLSELARTLSTQHVEALRESQNLRKSVDHIADLVRSQQAYAGSRGVFELTSLAAEIETALKISVQAFGRDMDLEVVRDFREVPLVSVDRHKLMEILINVIQNAKQAMRAAGVHRPVLAIALSQDQAGRVQVRITDNGEGIPPENLTRIFGHGFTTKPDGHGFGLHVSANAAMEMDAQLEASSEGPGKGATFLLSFPPAQRIALAGAAA